MASDDEVVKAADLQKRLTLLASLEQKLTELLYGVEQRVCSLEQRVNSLELRADVHMEPLVALAALEERIDRLEGKKA